MQFSCSVVSDSLWPHGLQHTRPSCPSPTPGVHSDSRPLSRWCHPTISSSVIPFSSCPQSFPASRSFQMSQLFAPGGQSIGVSASTSVLPMNIQGWFPLGLTGLISLQTQWIWIWVGDGQGGLACYSSWGCKESDTTEWLNSTESWAGLHNLFNNITQWFWYPSRFGDFCLLFLFFGHAMWHMRT